jgi:hypothetical protein
MFVFDATQRLVSHFQRVDSFLFFLRMSTCIHLPIAMDACAGVLGSKISLALCILNACDVESTAAQHAAIHLVREASAMDVKASWDGSLSDQCANIGLFPRAISTQIDNHVPWDKLETYTRFSMTHDGCDFRVAFAKTWHCVYTLPSDSDDNSHMHFVFVCANFFFAAAIQNGYITVALPDVWAVVRHPSEFALTHGTLQERVTGLVMAYDSFQRHRIARPAHDCFLYVSFCPQCYGVTSHSDVLPSLQTCTTCRTRTMQAIEVHLVRDLANMVMQYLLA